MELFSFNSIEIILFIIGTTLLAIQFIYYFGLYNKILLRHRATSRGEVHFSQELPPISVIITAREEYENLQRNLTSILEQDYPCFEVIVINDGNTDESEDYLTIMQERHSHLYHSFVPSSSRYISRKKLALSLGIKAAKHEWLVFTDANCQPTSNQWLRLMARNFTPHTQIVLGYSGYERGKGWLQKIINFENLFSQLRFLSFALIGKPYMGMGKNLAYRKSLFFEQKGYTTHLHLQHGADDLFVNQVANGNNTRVEIDAKSVMRMLPIKRKKIWREEKIGYANTARLYHGIQPMLLGFETFSRLMFHITWITVVVEGILHMQWVVASIGLLLFIVRFTTQAIIINKSAKVLNEKYRYYSLLPLFDFFQPWLSFKWRMHCLLRKKQEFMRK